MIESKMLGAAAGVQYQGNNDELNRFVTLALASGVVVGRFKRGRMDKPFKVTANTYKALLGNDPFNPSFTMVDDAFITGASEVMVMRIGDLLF